MSETKSKEKPVYTEQEFEDAVSQVIESLKSETAEQIRQFKIKVFNSIREVLPNLFVDGNAKSNHFCELLEAALNGN